MKKIKGVVKIFRYIALTFVVVLGFIATIGTGGGGGGGGETTNNQEREIQTVYSFFDLYYLYQDSVREPYSEETIEEYVDSYRSWSDIYTKHFDENEMSNVYDHFETEETLIVRTYSPSILYIAFEKFVNGTAGRVIEAMNTYINLGYNKFILDLRINGGGVVKEAIYLLDFLTSSQPNYTFLCWLYGPAVYETYYLGEYTYLYGLETTFNNSNMYVLTSASTASSAEILVAGLVDFNEATQIGSTTFGKSRVITIRDLSAGDGFEMTIGLVYHSDYADREGIGIIPSDTNTTDDPFVVAINRLGGSASDPLRDDWPITDSAYSNLYSQSYWRNKEYYARSIQSFRRLQSTNE